MAVKAAAYPKVYLYRRIVYAKLFIDKHFADRIDLNLMAGEAAFSKYHFIRSFSSVYKKTPHQYLSAVRIDKAKELLKTDVPVAEVCYAVGFESVSSFTGLFKRLTGYTPSIYQALQRQRLSAVAADPLSFIPNCFAEKNGWQTLAILEK